MTASNVTVPVKTCRHGGLWLTRNQANRVRVARMASLSFTQPPGPTELGKMRYRAKRMANRMRKARGLSR